LIAELQERFTTFVTQEAAIAEEKIKSSHWIVSNVKEGICPFIEKIQNSSLGTRKNKFTFWRSDLD